MKYELIENDYCLIRNRKFYRIRALKDFGDVKKGDLGGYVEKNDVISHQKDCWAYPDSFVDALSFVWGNSKIINSRIFNCDVFDSYVKSSNLENNYSKKSKIINSDLKYCQIYNCEVEDIDRIPYTRKLSFLEIHKIRITNFEMDRSVIFHANGRKVLFYKDKYYRIKVICGCQSGISLDSFRKRITKDGDEEKLVSHRKEYLKMIDLAKIILTNH